MLGPDLSRELSGDELEPGAAFRGLAWGWAIEGGAALVLVAAVVLLLRWQR